MVRTITKQSIVFKLLLMLVLLCFTSLSVYAQEHSDHDLAKKAANPIANIISIPMQLNLNFGIGDYDRSSQVFNIMPTIPFADWLT